MLLGWLPPTGAQAHTRDRPAADAAGQPLANVNFGAATARSGRNPFASEPARNQACDVSGRLLVAAANPNPTQSFQYDAVGELISTPAPPRVVPRFWTMDTTEGDQDDSLSLHKYMYGAGNPVDNDDPSGHDPFDVTGGPAFIDALYEAVGLMSTPSLNTTVMNKIAQNAMVEANAKSMNWATAAKYGKYGPGVDKCNIFWSYEARRSGAIVPNTSGSRFGGWITRNPPLASQLADSSFFINHWPVIQKPVPGAVISGGNHVGIVAADGASSISVFHGTYVIHNDLAFRAVQPFQPVFRGYDGP